MSETREQLEAEADQALDDAEELYSMGGIDFSEYLNRLIEIARRLNIRLANHTNAKNEPKYVSFSYH